MLNLASGLGKVAERLEPKEAARVCSQAATTLTQAMTKTTDPNALSNLASGLAQVAMRLDASEACHTLLRLIAQTTDADAYNHLAQALELAAGHA